MTPAPMLRQQRIRELLREQQDGLTAMNLSRLLGLGDKITKETLEAMPDAYIDRWVDSPSRHKYEPVWCVVVPPDNCPRPGAS